MVYRYAVNLAYPNGGGPGTNVWHFRGELGPDDVQQITDAIELFYSTALTVFQPSTVITGPTEVVAGIEGSSPTFEAVDGFTLNVGSAGQSLPPSQQVVVGWRTTDASRSGRGRTFVGPLNTAAQEANGTPAAATLTTIRAAAQTVVDFNNTFANGAIGVWSPTDNVLRDITAFTVRDVFAVLRSRRD